MQYFWTHKMFYLEMLHCVAVDLMISLKSDLLWLPFPCKIGYKLDTTEGVYQIDTYHIQHRYIPDNSKVISTVLKTFDGCRPIIQYLVHWFYKLLSTQKEPDVPILAIVLSCFSAIWLFYQTLPMEHLMTSLCKINPYLLHHCE